MLYILNDDTYDLTPTFSENLLINGANVVRTTFINSKNQKYFMISSADVADAFFDENNIELDISDAIKRIQE